MAKITKCRLSTMHRYSYHNIELTLKLGLYVEVVNDEDEVIWLIKNEEDLQKFVAYMDTIL